jgi:hypothetical protein
MQPGWCCCDASAVCERSIVIFLHFPMDEEIRRAEDGVLRPEKGTKTDPARDVPVT